MKIVWVIGIIAVAVVIVFAVRHRQDQALAAETGGSYAAAQKAFLADNIKKPGWKATPSGLQYKVLKAPDASAPHPAPGSVVTVNYEGRLTDGSVFDSSYARHQPISFPLSGVIQGWQEGVPMMRVGDTWEFAIPSELAYGPDTAGPIPGGSTLLFKVELLKAQTTVP